MGSIRETLLNYANYKMPFFYWESSKNKLNVCYGRLSNKLHRVADESRDVLHTLYDTAALYSDEDVNRAYNKILYDADSFITFIRLDDEYDGTFLCFSCNKRAQNSLLDVQERFVKNEYLYKLGMKLYEESDDIELFLYGLFILKRFELEECLLNEIIRFAYCKELTVFINEEFIEKHPNKDEIRTELVATKDIVLHNLIAASITEDNHLARKLLNDYAFYVDGMPDLIVDRNMRFLEVFSGAKVTKKEAKVLLDNGLRLIKNNFNVRYCFKCLEMPIYSFLSFYQVNGFLDDLDGYPIEIAQYIDYFLDREYIQNLINEGKHYNALIIFGYKTNSFSIIQQVLERLFLNKDENEEIILNCFKLFGSSEEIEKQTLKYLFIKELEEE